MQFELAAHDVLRGLVGEPVGASSIPDIQVIFRGNLTPTYIRDITADDVNRMVQVPGIVINASRTRAKASKVAIYCPTCGDRRSIPCPPAFGGALLPRRCPDTYVLRKEPYAFCHLALLMVCECSIYRTLSFFYCCADNNDAGRLDLTVQRQRIQWQSSVALTPTRLWQTSPSIWISRRLNSKKARKRFQLERCHVTFCCLWTDI